MRVTRLEIFGFKSFVERFTLAFDHNLLGVVGPNGCGKSNIVDSLRWVLGETHAKQLRGSALEDLIFNGSDSRRPLGMAEVSITIKPDQGWSERLETTQDELGKILDEADQVLDATDAAARSEQEKLQAEVAPPAGADLKSSETGQAVGAEPDANQPATEVLPKLASVQNSAAKAILHSGLLDIPGLFNAAEIQLTRRLYRSGESEYFINRVPCRLRDMLDLYRIIGLGARGLSIVQQGQIGQLISKKPVERRELLEEAAGISGFRTKLESAQRKLEKTSFNMERLRDIILEVEKQVKVLKRQAQRARTRGELKQALEEAELGLFRARSAKILLERLSVVAQAQASIEEVGSLRARLDEQEAQQHDLQALLEEFDTNVYRLRLQRDEVYQTLLREREQRQSHERELVRLDTVGSNLERQGVELAERQEQIVIELGVIEDEQIARQRATEELREQAAQVEQQLEQVRAKTAERLQEIEQQSSAELRSGSEALPSAEIQEMQNQVAGLDSVVVATKELDREVGAKRNLISQLQRDVHKQRVRQTALSTERSSLQRQLAALAEHVISTVGDPAAVGEQLGRSLISGLKIPPELETAIAAVLGERGSFVVSEQALQLAEQFAERQQHTSKRVRVGVIAVSQAVLDPRPLTPAELEAAPEACFLTERIGVDGEVVQSLKTLLGEVVLVDTLKSAIALQQQAQNQDFSRTVVTAAGEVVTPWGWYTTQGETASYSFARRIEELNLEESAVNTELEQAEARFAREEQSLRELAERRSELESSRDEIQAVQRKLSQAIERERAEQRKQQEQVRAKELALRQVALQEEREVQQALNEVRSQARNTEYAFTVAAQQIEKLNGEIERMGARRERLSLEREQVVRERALAEQKLRELAEQTNQATLQSTLEELEQQVKQVEQERNTQASVVGSVAQEVSERRKVFEAARERQSRTELAVEKLDLELRLLREDVARYYGEGLETPTLELAQSLAAELGTGIAEHIDAVQSEAVKLRQRLEREGEVDPDAIERFEQESVRLTTMEAQYADLDSACKTLDRTIRRLKELSRSRFLETFNDVSRRFEELVPRLFGGGAGKMELVNPEDPLTSGVEISVRPPGKRLSNMELLSGGEKALVATAVLIAMFLHRPSPICVLDEVDAPLDDANLERFLALIKEISARTQFLIITHNKASMAAVDRLVGITMQESGVSTALSVTLREAEEQLESWAVNA